MVSLQEARKQGLPPGNLYGGSNDGDFAANRQRRQSIGIGSMFEDLLAEDEDEEEEIKGQEKYQWKYSEYKDAVDREEILLNGDDRASSIMSGKSGERDLSHFVGKITSFCYVVYCTNTVKYKVHS